MSVILLGGQIVYVDDPAVPLFSNGDDIGMKPNREVVGRVSLYLTEHDVVREIDLRGLTVAYTQWEPTLEDRLAVAAFEMAGLLRDEGLDMHDFHEIVRMAYWGIEYHGGEKSELAGALDRIDHLLGGPE